MQSKPNAPSTLINAYHAGWSVLAGVAGIYLLTLVMRPELVEPLEDPLRRAPQALAAIGAAIGGLQREVKDIRVGLAAQDRRIGTLEHDNKRPQPAPVTAPGAPAEAQPPPPITAAQLGPAVKILNQAAARPAEIVTGSIGDRTAAPQVGVLLAIGPSIDALRLSWALLQDKHRTTLKSLEPRVTGGDSEAYTLIAGPIASQSDAQKICAALKSRGVTCRPAAFEGSALQ